MEKFFLYKKEAEKPYFVLIVGEKAWLVAFSAPFEPMKKRLAVEISPEDEGITRPFDSAAGLIESGEVVFNREGGAKIDFTVLSSSGSLMSGNFVFIVPSWGKRTKRRLWVIVKSRK